MFPFKVSLSGNNSRIFLPKCRLVLFVFFGCYRRPWLFSLSQAMTRGERSVKRKRRQNSNRTRIIAGSLSRSPPSYSKANLGITHTESLFAGYRFRRGTSSRHVSVGILKLVMFILILIYHCLFTLVLKSPNGEYTVF